MTNHAHHDADFSHAPEPTQLDIQTGVSRRRERVQPLWCWVRSSFWIRRLSNYVPLTGCAFRL